MDTSTEGTVQTGGSERSTTVIDKTDGSELKSVNVKQAIGKTIRVHGTTGTGGFSVNDPQVGSIEQKCQNAGLLNLKMQSVYR